MALSPRVPLPDAAAQEGKLLVPAEVHSTSVDLVCYGVIPRLSPAERQPEYGIQADAKPAQMPCTIAAASHQRHSPRLLRVAFCRIGGCLMSASRTSMTSQ